MMNFDYDAEALRIGKELTSGKFDIEVFENTGTDYEIDMNSDIEAFKKHLDSEESKSLANWIFRKQ